MWLLVVMVVVVADVADGASCNEDNVGETDLEEEDADVVDNETDETASLKSMRRHSSYTCS